MRLESSDAGNDPSNTSTRHAFDLLAKGFGPGFNGPLLIAAKLPSAAAAESGAADRSATRLLETKDVVTVDAPRVSPSGKVAILEAFPASAPQAPATTDLVNRLRNEVLPPLKHETGMTVLVGGLTAGSIDFSHVLAAKLPRVHRDRRRAVGVAPVRDLPLACDPDPGGPDEPAQHRRRARRDRRGLPNGVLSRPVRSRAGPIEPWIPVLMFAVVFGLSMDYEVFLISRVREEWVRQGDASTAVADGIAYTGRVITAAAAIMICVFLSFMLGNERPIKEFGFGLAAAVFLDALVVRCVMLPAVLELLGPLTWRLPPWLDARLPHFRIEGVGEEAFGEEPDREESPALV